MTVPHNATKLRTETEAKNFLIYKHNKNHIMLSYSMSIVNRLFVDF